MPDAALRAALLDHAAACDAAGMPRCAALAVALASGTLQPRPLTPDEEAEGAALWALVEIFGDEVLGETPESRASRRCA